MNGDPLEWYNEIPVVSRIYLTLSFITTASCALDLVSPFSLYFNFKLIVYKGQMWRLFTNFFFFGMFSLDFLFHMYFLVRYCRLLEEGSYRGRTADFVFMLILGATIMLIVAPFINVHFLGSSLTFMMVYVWGQRNPRTRMSFLGLFPFTAPYLPWVLFSFSVMLGNSATIDLVGIAVGHVYFYLEDVLPKIAHIRGWRVQKFLVTPKLLRHLLDAPDRVDELDIDNLAFDGADMDMDLGEMDLDFDNDQLNGGVPQEQVAAEADVAADGPPAGAGGGPPEPAPAANIAPGEQQAVAPVGA